jgi:hypothetical protein
MLLLESRGIFQRQGDTTGVAASTNQLGIVAHDQGNYARAITMNLESFDLFEQVGSPHGAIESLEWIAVSAGSAGLHESAMRLFGATVALRAALDLDPIEFEATDIEKGMQYTRHALGSDAEAQLLRGLNLSKAQARELASNLGALFSGCQDSCVLGATEHPSPRSAPLSS